MADIETLLAEVRGLRQDLESQAAIAVVAGINAVETQALLGHFLRKRKAPTPAEAQALSRLARERWSAQVRQAVALARREPGGIDDSLPLLLQAMGGAEAKKTKPHPARPKRAKVVAKAAPGRRRR